MVRLLFVTDVCDFDDATDLPGSSEFSVCSRGTELMAEDTVMPGKILIVEDNSRLAESLAVLLNEAGYETSLATNSGQSGALMSFSHYRVAALRMARACTALEVINGGLARTGLWYAWWRGYQTKASDRVSLYIVQAKEILRALPPF